MNKQQKQEALEWLVNDTDPANYIVVDFEGGKVRGAVMGLVMRVVKMSGRSE